MWLGAWLQRLAWKLSHIRLWNYWIVLRNSLVLYLITPLGFSQQGKGGAEQLDKAALGQCGLALPRESAADFWCFVQTRHPTLSSASVFVWPWRDKPDIGNCSIMFRGVETLENTSNATVNHVILSSEVRYPVGCTACHLCSLFQLPEVEVSGTLTWASLWTWWSLLRMEGIRTA